MSEKRRRFKIYRDEAKERLTNHWDIQRRKLAKAALLSTNSAA